MVQNFRYFILLISLNIASTAFAQQTEDSTKTLDEVIVRAFEEGSPQRSGRITRIIERNNADRDSRISLVQGFNTVPGVRMEERSPGSYRINIRGSSLRSPFGVRNVKVYWNDLVLTDASGNTYFNQVAANNFSYLEIHKGPPGSMYGAGTGGLILMHNLAPWKPGADLEYIAGSFGTHNLFAAGRFGKNENRNQFTYAHNESNGYRVQSALRRDNFSATHRVKWSERQELTASLLFTDMYYQTPGGLNNAERKANPRAARPAAGIFPSAVDARAAIFQQNLLTGFSNKWDFRPGFHNRTSLYGMFNQVKNPAIRNYERRKEPGFGGRTVFVFEKRPAINESVNSRIRHKWAAGAEWNEGYYQVQVFDNRGGNPDTLRTNDEARFSNQTFFVQGDYFFRKDWLLNFGASVNQTRVVFTRLSEYPVREQVRKFRSEFAPRLKLQKKGDHYSIGLLASRGFSPPTLPELLPSTSEINNTLQAERGWNFEMNSSAGLLRNRLDLYFDAYYFRLEDALVQRRDASGADFFVNAGSTVQKGLELMADFVDPGKKGFLDYWGVRFSYGYQHYRYRDFVRGNTDFSGKTIPSVPAHTFSVLTDWVADNGLYLQLNFYSASSIFLDDANAVKADPYHLLFGRLGWRIPTTHKTRLHVYAGAENLLDEAYSAGHDINAAAGRYFNPGAGRSYYAGLRLEFSAKK